jgi:tetratricopeptide (TPR) repeat protein
MKKSFSIIILSLVLMAAAVGQTYGGQQQQPAGQAPAGSQPQAGAQPAQPAPAAPAGRRVLQAQSAEEQAAYLAVVNNPDMTAAEAGAADFVVKFPTSQLRGTLYQVLQSRYQNANNADKTIEMGRKSIEYDPDNTWALAITASVLADRTRETDLDRDERLAEVAKHAQRAIETIDTGLALAPSATEEQVQMMKSVLLGVAHEALGVAETVRKNDAAAEQHFRKATEINQARPDPLTWLRLALTLDRQKKYPEALQAANRAVEIAQAQGGGQVHEMAKQEQARLTQLTGTK